MKAHRDRPDAGTQLAEKAYADLRQAIIRCDLEPGGQVTEAQLAERCGHGRAAVRAALKRLYQDGLVQPIPRKGHTIAPITLKSIYDLFAIRVQLECFAVRQAVGRVDMAQLHRLDELCRAGYRLGDRESAAAFLQANSEFHLTIARSAGNPRLTQMIAGLLDEMERFFHLGLMVRDRTTEMYAEHKDLLDALVAGDADRAERVTREQIASGQKMVVDALLNSPSLQSVNLA